MARQPLTRRQIKAVRELSDAGGVLDMDRGLAKDIWLRFSQRTWRALEEKGVINVTRGEVYIHNGEEQVKVADAVKKVEICVEVGNPNTMGKR